MNSAAKSKYLWRNLNNPYEYRDDNLARLGFDSYKKYLRSELWKAIRKTVMERDHYRCQYCGRRANSVHHRAYDPKTLTGECLHALSSICSGCHRRIEEPENLRRNRWDRLHDGSALLLKKQRKRKIRAVHDPIWAQHVEQPRLVKGKVKTSGTDR